MNLILYTGVGFLTAFIGALPLGTVNVSVINTTIKEDIVSALKIVYPAAIAELALIFLAMMYHKIIQTFINENLWVEYSIVAILIVIGFVFLFGKKDCIKDDTGECIVVKKRFQLSKPILGFTLGLFNPAVLIYWLLVISFLDKKMIPIQLNMSIFLVLLFFTGAFIGKSLTLYGYGKFSNVLKMKMKGITAVINKVIGSVLCLIAIIQFTKLFFTF